MKRVEFGELRLTKFMRAEIEHAMTVQAGAQ